MQSASPQVIPLPGAAEEGHLQFPVRRRGPGYSPESSMDSVDNLEITNILLLDDDAELADTLKQLLEAHNFVVTLAKNGIEGLRETMAMDFDVIICDLMMPTMPGDMFYLAVQKTKPHLCSRFLFVTGHGNDPRTMSFLQSTEGLTIFKPVPSEELVQMISLVILRNSR